MLYRSTKCGILENDLILGSFARKNISQLSSTQLEEYRELLQEENDWDILKWCTAPSLDQVPERWRDSSIISLIRTHVHKGQKY
jgi:succinate dehydrogenase flavin-adding protein (antitoxin of CptAB toxin-antitoxin module)